jgi:hypothetical protein
VRVSVEDLRDLVREVDRDGSGDLCYRELAEFLRRKEPSWSLESSGSIVSALTSGVSRRVGSELRARFDAAVGSGRLDRFEDAFRGADPRDTGLVSGRAFEDALSDLAVSTTPDVATVGFGELGVGSDVGSDVRLVSFEFRVDLPMVVLDVGFLFWRRRGWSLMTCEPSLGSWTLGARCSTGLLSRG